MKRFAFLFLLFQIILFEVSGQTGTVRGKIYDAVTKEAIPFANIILQGTTIGGTSDVDGFFLIENITPGLYNIQASYVGYEQLLIPEVQISNNIRLELNLEMKASAVNIDEVVVRASPFVIKEESPLSLNTIGANEIQRSPGSNRDISRVISLLPGVGSTLSFRNDLLVRGGAPSENRFYIDGIEIPTINHFTTQGASGGSNGLINVDFIKNVDFYSGAFPANRGNALSSVMEFTQLEGRKDRIGARITVGASEAGITLEGPITEKSSFMLSARRSYLQLLFKAFELPFLPTFNDFQFKSTHKINKNHDITFVGVGAYDDFKLNLALGETEEQQYFLGNLPYIKQWNYTLGTRYRWFRKNGTLAFVLSRNMLNNKSFKYQDNENNNPDKLILDYNSFEAENKFRFEHTLYSKGYKINYGVGYEFVNYSNETFNRIALPFGGTEEINYASKLNFHKYYLFAQVSKNYFKERLLMSLGVRADGNNFSSSTTNLFKHLSPRFSLSYAINENLRYNFNAGLYYQMPAYTVLGFRDNEGVLVNRENKVGFINNKQIVSGFSYTTKFNTKFSIEGFYKWYDNYPLLVAEGISVANQGGFFGVVGAAEALSLSKGKAYGVEFLAQQKLYKNLYGILSYTFSRSFFTNADNISTPSSWDTRHLLNLSIGYKLPKNWEVGVVWRFTGGLPYTPLNEELSLVKESWDVRGQGVEDYTQINAERLKAYHQLDLRVDKKWFFKKWNLNLYLDIVNVYNFAGQAPAILTVQRDAFGNPLENPDNPNSYLGKFLENSNGNLIPSIGLVVEF